MGFVARTLVSAASTLVSTLLGGSVRPSKCVEKSLDAADTSARATSEDTL
jgi:hypothetical protein